LERKNENSEKYFGSLSKWCKTKKSGGAKCKRHGNIGEKFKIPGGAPAPPHLHTAPPLVTILFQDQVGGLEAFVDNKWLAIRPQPNTFVINIGDTFKVCLCIIYILLTLIVSYIQQKINATGLSVCSVSR
jgi:hypothetical protein